VLTLSRQPNEYIQSMLHGHGNVEMDKTRGHIANSYKYTWTRVSDTRVKHISDTTRLHDRSVCAT